MSDPKREKLKTEARAFIRGIVARPDSWSDNTNRLADWAERREREAVAELVKDIAALRESVAATVKGAVIEAVAEERERCARLCVRRSVTWSEADDLRSEDFREGIEHAASQLAAHIRALDAREKAER